MFTSRATSSIGWVALSYLLLFCGVAWPAHAYGRHLSVHGPIVPLAPGKQVSRELEKTQVSFRMGQGGQILRGAAGDDLPGIPERINATLDTDLSLQSRRRFLQFAGPIMSLAVVDDANAAFFSTRDLPQSEFLSKVEKLPRPLVPSKVPASFAVYLTGYLIRYDKEWRTWWRDQVRATPSYYRPAYIFDSKKRQLVVRARYTEVTKALQRRAQCVDIFSLCQLLYDMYTELPGKYPKHHLAILFCFLDAPQQPRRLIINALRDEYLEDGITLTPAEVLRKYTSYADFLAPKELKVATESVSLISGFYTPQLLPSNLYPLYVKGRDEWIVPESAEMKKFPNERGEIVISNYDIDQPYRLPNSLAFTWYTLMFLAYSGGLSNAFTYSAVQPLEVVKTRMQATGSSFPVAISSIVEQSGWRGLTVGMGATSLGMFIYGFIIFPMFELGKLYVADTLGEDLVANYRLPFVLIISILCTLAGSLFLVPFETVKIKMIASPERFLKPSSKQPPEHSTATGVATTQAVERPEMLSLLGVFHLVRDTDGWSSLWKSYPVLCIRNIMCNIGRFTIFDAFDDIFVFFVPTAATLLTSEGQMPIWLLLFKGAVAGMSAAIFSTPADSILTKVTRSKRPNLSIAQAAREVYEEQGIKGYFRGVFPRIAWAVLINTSQVFFYQGLKDLFFDNLLLNQLLHVSS